MKLLNIRIHGFGKLVNREFHFAPGLNLVFGPNEAGKSTLQRAILSALYGFFDEGSITAAKRAALAGCEPWQLNADYSLSMTFMLENGMKYEVQRTFAPNLETHLIDIGESRDISSRFRSGSQGRLFFADELLGMPKNVFENTSFVRQAELLALDQNSSAITDALLRLSASASQESTATQAVSLLDSALNNHIGSARAWTKPLAQAREKLKKLEEARNQAIQNHQRLNIQLNELFQSQEKLSRLEYEVARNRYLLWLAEKDRLQKQKKAVEEAAQRVGRQKQKLAELEKYAYFPDDLQDIFVELNNRRGQLVAQSRREYERALRSAGALPSISKQLSDLTQQASQIAGMQAPTFAPLPLIDSSFDLEAAETVYKWLDQHIQIADRILHSAQERLGNDEITLAALIKLRQQGLASYRERLRGCETQIRQKQDVIDKLQREFDADGLAEEHWEEILEAESSRLKEWEVWSSFPAETLEEVQYLEKQRSQLCNQIQTLELQSAETRRKLEQLNAQIADIEKALASSKGGLLQISEDQIHKLQKSHRQVSICEDVLGRAKERLAEIEKSFQAAELAIQAEEGQIRPLTAMGMAGLSELRSRYLFAQQRFSEAVERAEAAKTEWSRLGMPISHFQELEKTVKSIQSGQSPMPKLRKGCKSLLPLQKKVAIPDQTPTEIILYTQGQPIYAEMIRTQTDAQAAEKNLQAIENEILQTLGSLIDTPIQANSFSALEHRLQIFQENYLKLESQRSAMIDARHEVSLAEEQVQQACARLRNLLVEVGFTDPDVYVAWQDYLSAYEKLNKFTQEETNLSRLQLEARSLEAEVKVLLDKQVSLTRVEEELCKQLQAAGVVCGRDEIEAGLIQYQKRLGNYNEWRKKYLEYESLSSKIGSMRSKMEQARQELIAAQADLDELKSEISQALGNLVDGNIDEYKLADLERRLEQYHEDKRLLQITQDRVERLKVQIQDILQNIAGWRDCTQELGLVNNQLLEILNRAGINCELAEIGQGIQSFLDISSGHAAWRQAQNDLQVAIRNYDAIQAGLSQVDEDIKALDIKINTLKATYPGFKKLTPQATCQAYEKSLQQLEGELQAERESVNRMKDAVERFSKSLTHLADLDEDIATARSEVKQLEFFQRALDHAKSELEISTMEFQKLFAPRLEREMNLGLRSITSGRYTDVRVDPNSLELRVRSPERNDFVKVDYLSTGTRDLMYLILRVGLTKLMSSAGERLPLLLDDPLVQFDRERQSRALEYIRQLADETQVLLFTKDEVTLGWFKACCSALSQHKLHELG